MSDAPLLSFHFYLYGADRGPLATSFEAAAERLGQLERLYFEPDGSFVWAQAAQGEEVYGMLYDRCGVVQYCDMRGRCRHSSLIVVAEKLAGHEFLPKLQILHLPESRWQDFQSFAGFSPLG